MKKHPKLVQTDKRGQLVIPKALREELEIDESTGFYLYSIPGEGILLKKIKPEPLKSSDAHNALVAHANELGISHAQLQQAINDYNNTEQKK